MNKGSKGHTGAQHKVGCWRGHDKGEVAVDATSMSRVDRTGAGVNLLLLGVPAMGLRTGWGKVSLDEGFTAVALIVMEGMAVCGDTWDGVKRWLCSSDHNELRQWQW